MAPTVPNAVFSSSSLVRVLTDLLGASVSGPPTALAEKLGQWLGWADAIALSSVLNSRIGEPPDADDWKVDFYKRVVQQIEHVRSALVDAIKNDELLAPGGCSTSSRVTTALSLDFPAYRRCHGAHQRAMELGVSALRVQVREVITKASPRLAHLALLDAALERALATRERSLLAKVPSMLEVRFQKFHADREQALPDALPGSTSQAATGRAAFGCELQSVLLAELEMRLQPVEGLVEALRKFVAPTDLSSESHP